MKETYQGHSQECDVLLFIPNSRWYGKRPWLLIPNSALILTGLLKDKFSFGIVDANIANYSEEEATSQIAKRNPKIFLVSGISVEYFAQYHNAFLLAKKINRNVITIFGGIYPTLLPHEALEDKNIDYIFRGPAEGNRASQFIKCLLSENHEKAKMKANIGYNEASGKSHVNTAEKFITDLKGAPEPDYSLIDTRGYLNEQSADYNIGFESPTGVMLTSYGCKYNCLFCAAKTIRGKGVVYRPAKNVIREMRWLIHEYGVTHFSFLDELFLGDRKRAENILDFMIREKVDLTWKMPNVSAWHLDDKLLELMKKAGCRAISVSVESGSERVLKEIIRKPMKLSIFPRIVKKCKELDIDIVANFVIGLPGETWQEIRKTFQVAEDLDFDLCSFHIATPYPGTDLFKIASEQNLLSEGFNFKSPEYSGTSQGFITTCEFTPFELMILRSFEWDRINFKTDAKIQKIANMMNLPVAELNEHRRQSRLKCGVHYLASA